MGGIDVGGGGGGKRKSLDSEINMIPMIDLLMVTISFLLITAVWTHMARINADAQVPGPPRPDVEQEKTEPEKQLHIEMRDEDKFVLVWKQGSTTVDSIDVPRKDVIDQQGAVQVVRFPDLADKVESEWKAKGQHSNPTDRKLDQAILHTDNKTEFKYIIGVIDAVYETHRDMQLGPKTDKVPAFNITFAVN
ncbi:MAG TPA: biopolymer transporter ExbD [Polyangiaceae bacterium]|jgi:biopolymer transport protein ExbD|nr:biopolymer transporter ExbD [Polyangiaceae bacterium]